MKDFLKIWAVVVGLIGGAAGLMLLGGWIIPMLPEWVLWTLGVILVTLFITTALWILKHV